MNGEQIKALRTVERLGTKRGRLQAQLADTTDALFDGVLAADALKIPRREIAKAAQISPQTVYNVIGRKEDA